MSLKVFTGLLALIWLSSGAAQFRSTDTLELHQNEIVSLMESVIHTAAVVEVARADIDRAEASANLLRAGPYEFQLEVSGGRREINDPVLSPQKYTEWEGGVSRTFRLPGKRGTDQDLAEIEVELARAAYENALYTERLAFIDRWSTWSTAYRLAEISNNQAQEIATLAELEQKRADQGAGRQVNADQLRAESELAALQASQAELELMTARIQLESYYPNISISNPDADFSQLATTIEALLGSNIGKLPQQYVAEVSSEKARLLAQRARQDKLPDPTIGLAFTDELGGLESSVAATISIPIGGSSRRASLEQAEAVLNMSELELAAAQRAAMQQIGMIENVARVSLQSIHGAAAAGDVSQRALAQFQQGYELGALTLSDLITARRSHYLVARSLAEQQGSNEQALMSYLALSFSQIEAAEF